MRTHRTVRPTRFAAVPLGAIILSLTLAACGSGSAPAGTAGSATTAPASSPAAPGSSGAAPDVPAVTAGRTLATGLRVPWGVTFLPDGSALVGQRPTGQIIRVTSRGQVTPIGTVPQVADQGEGGLLGLAFQPRATGGGGTLYAYRTGTDGKNAVVRMTFDGSRLGTPATVLTGIASANNHNGGALVIGPDQNLWIGTGDATIGRNSQDRSSLNGKILRITLDGAIPADNPFPGSPVYSLGHRNVQGIAFDSSGQPWAVEFGQNTWDELNRIRPGGNYGWPGLEGKAGRTGFIDPLVQWPTDDASPSGLAIVDDVAYAGGLRGERLWQVALPGDRSATAPRAAPEAFLRGQFGRLRTVAAAPGGGLWMTTSNRDGRGSPRDGDDRVVQLTLG